ncbi:MAG: PilZ domain-containing protein [Pseudorhodoplanes sp.]|uniref:PilZ domain-containing protein n=1 Tax=Pseudorhodoplanes sp. TaxID=1934341 RepID=UPI003D13B27D
MLERRKSQRLRTLKSGSVMFGFVPDIACRVRNMSSGGACLELERRTKLPGDFSLLIKPEYIRRSCRLVWQSDLRVGVQFVSGC